jgi:hypothetical protein
MGANLELWTYRLFKNDCLYLKEVLQKSYAPSTNGGVTGEGGQPLTAGQKAALTAATGSYKWEEHLKGKPEKIQQLAQTIRESRLGKARTRLNSALFTRAPILTW